MLKIFQHSRFPSVPIRLENISKISFLSFLFMAVCEGVDNGAALQPESLQANVECLKQDAVHLVASEFMRNHALQDQIDGIVE